ncbi:hypothetical protein FRB98_001988 [Tulasnella sp. 332]|nr:hypothetical protein FRB98_001988 [Tulasnella sp. 332]
MLVLLEDQVGKVDNQRINDAATEITHILRRVQKKMDEWVQLGRVRSFVKQEVIARDLREFQSQLEYACRRFQMNSAIEIIRATELFEQSRARDMDHLTTILQAIASSQDDLKSLTTMQPMAVETVMRSMQEELSQDSDNPNRAILQDGLAQLKEETGILPPLTDLSGEIKRLGDTPVDIGSTADIWQGEWLGETVALKVLRNVGRMDRQTEKNFRREIDIWRRLKHKHVLPLYGICFIGSLIHLVSPFAKNSHTLNYFRLNPDADRVKLVAQAASGLAYLHSHSPPIIHGDLRAVNVLVSQAGDAFISDFGLARLEQVAGSETITSLDPAGACRWMAPELIAPAPGARTVQTTYTDVWSFGMFAFEVFTGERPYNHLDRNVHVINTVSQGYRHSQPRGVAESRGLSDSMWALMMSCWHEQPCERPDMDTVSETLSTPERFRSGKRQSKQFSSTHDVIAKQSSLLAATRPTRGDTIVPTAREEEPEPSDVDWRTMIANMSIVDHEVESMTGPKHTSTNHSSTTFQPSSPISPTTFIQGPLSSSPQGSGSLHSFAASSSFGSTNPLISRTHGTSGNGGPLTASPLANPVPLSPETTWQRPPLRPGTGSSSSSIRTLTTIGPSPRLNTPTVLPESGALEVLMSTNRDAVVAGTLEGLINVMVVQTAGNVLKILRQWLEIHRAEPGDWNVLVRMYNFASGIKDPSTIASTAGKLIGEIIEPELRRIQDAQPRDSSQSIFSMESTTRSILRAHLSELTPRELAECFTIIESQLFYVIRPTDCVVYLKKPKANPDSPISLLVHKNEQLTAWIQKSILKHLAAKERAREISYFVEAALECKLLGNFASLRAIVLALQSSSIGQLKRTKEAVPPAVAQNLRLLADLVDGNKDYELYRRTLRSSRGAVLPILYAHLRTINYVHSKVQPTIQGDSGPLINFQRYDKLRVGIEHVLELQYPQYSLKSSERKLQFVEEQLRCMVLDEAWRKRLEKDSLKAQGQEENEYRSFRGPLADLGII